MLSADYSYVRTALFSFPHKLLKFQPLLLVCITEGHIGKHQFLNSTHFGGVFNPDAKKFIACPVALKDMRVPQANDQYPEKIKVRRVCASCFEVDIDGNPVKGG